MMQRNRFLGLLGIELLCGLAFRWYLAFRVFRAQGFAWDLSTFADWMQTIADHGHAAYAVDPSINYPPVFAQLLQLLNLIGGHLTGYQDPALGQGPWLLLKWLPVLADLGIAALLAYAGRRWYSEGTGLWAAGLYLAVPVTWYDSAIWGQMDSVAALPMLAAVILMLDRRPELAVAAFIAGVLTKPQASLALIVLVPLCIGQVRSAQIGARRLGTTFLAAIGSFALLVNSWSLSVYTTGWVSHVPILSNAAGLARQYFATNDLFPYLSVNAFNIWALARKPSMARQMSSGSVTWTTDNATVLGIPGHALGIALFSAVCLLVVFTVASKPEPTAVFAGLGVVLIGFFVLTTRVHERYLAEAFAVIALIWASSTWGRVLTLALGLANVINLHAILVGGLQIKTAILGAPLPANPYPHQGMPPEVYGFSWPTMPLWATTSYPAVLLAIGGTTFALVIAVIMLIRQSVYMTERVAS